MIEAKALKAIREAEIKADKMIASARDEAKAKVELARKAAAKRIEDERVWATDRGEKIVNYAVKEANQERDKRIALAESDIEAMKMRSSQRKKNAIDAVIKEICGELP